KKFSDRLRKSKTTLEVFEEGWNDSDALQYQIYLAGAREAAYQLLGSREPTEMLQSRVKEAGRLSSRKMDYLTLAFQSGYRTALLKLESGISMLRIFGAAAALLGVFGFVWIVMVGFDSAKTFEQIGPEVGAGLGFIVVSFLIIIPSKLARLAFGMIAKNRRRQLQQFRDDISRLFERSFALRENHGGSSASAAGASKPSAQAKRTQSSVSGEPEFEAGVKKQYHSIREKLVSKPDGDAREILSLNPIARQTAVLRAK
ncbi:hypothetical protein N9B73_12490, partial [Verrucomicrobiales bacterium]|nr:hypothetical protein [Verrucomicrobiales bacterium]